MLVDVFVAAVCDCRAGGAIWPLFGGHRPPLQELQGGRAPRISLRPLRFGLRPFASRASVELDCVPQEEGGMAV